MIRAIWRPLAVTICAASLAVLIGWLALPLVFLFSLDALMCARAYRQIKNTPISMATLARMRSTWCSRGVAIAAWGRSASAYFEGHGYGWWRILPDGFPLACCRRAFWARFFQLSH